MVEFNRSDLEFILTQIEIAEQHAAGTPLDQLIYNPLLPWGLRTVDGTYNNIIPGRETWGAADQPFPRLLDQPLNLVDADPLIFDPDGPSGTDQIGDPTSYTQTNGIVVDADPRLISNLVVDQTANNLAALRVAIDRAEITGLAAERAEAEVYALAKLKSAILLAKNSVHLFQIELANSDLTAPITDTTLNALAGRLEAVQAVVADAVAAADAARIELLVDSNGLDPLVQEVTEIRKGLRQVYNPDGNTGAGSGQLQAIENRIIAGQTPGELTVGELNNSVTNLVNSLNILSGDGVSGSTNEFGLDSRSHDLVNASLDEHGVPHAANGSLEIPNIAPDEGISAPFNSWMTLFGQFFDHGLDLVNKGGSGTIFIPLSPDDPNFVPGGHSNFMVLTRVTNDPGPDGVLGTDDDIRDHNNQTTPFVDQNQTYTSHASHQVFLREYVTIADGTDADTNPDVVSTGHLLEGNTGGLATWADIKAQAVDMLGLRLSDIHVLNVPLLATDEYGRFERGPNGFAQAVIRVVETDGVTTTTTDVLVEGRSGGLDLAHLTLADLPESFVPMAGATSTTITNVGTGHAFLDDIAHAAVPFGDLDGNPATPGNGALAADSDTDTGGSLDTPLPGQYDDELLNRHFITGDGRGNENIGLTAVHHVFHSEHNRMAEHTKDVVLATQDVDFINDWLLVPIAELPADPSALVWNGERLFQAARFGTEMQYQHLVFEEFARKVNPMVDLFIFNPTMDVNPAIFAEFAHVVYRFGHSMLNESVDRLAADGQSEDHITLIDAFLNPVAFDKDATLTADVAAGQIVRGMTRQTGNEIDEFVTDALRNFLVGLPLDLPALNIARGRDTGVPSLNDARAEFYEMTRSEWLKPYTSWVDFAQNLKNPTSIINFIAAYGTHDLIVNATTAEAKRDAATLLVLGGAGEPADRVAYLNGTGNWAGVETGLNNVDFWIGGLAEAILPFGGMLGSTFTFVFEAQLESLQNGDRFYYLSRTQGLHFLQELENNAFSKLVMLNTDLSEENATHLPGDIFARVDHILEMDTAIQMDLDPVHDDPILQALEPKVARNQHLTVDGNTYQNSLKFTGEEHVVLGGSEADDVLIADLGDDTIWGDGGNDLIIGGHGINRLHGGTGDDIVYGGGDAEFIHGDDGNDVIHGGNGLGDLIFPGNGNDFVIGGIDRKQVFGAEGSDFILGSPDVDFLLGGEGDDWIEGGEGFDTIAGENSELFFNSPIIGHDVLFSGTNENDFDAESGDDIMVQGESVIRNEGMFGFDWVSFEEHTSFGADADMRIKIFTTVEADILRNRFDRVEAMSGSALNDVLIGDDRIEGVIDPLEPEEFLPEDIFADDELTREGVERIDGFAAVMAPVIGDLSQYAADETVFNAGNVLLGGDGSDIIQGGGGDDIVDGDKWLNVRIGITGLDGLGNVVEVGTAQKMQGGVHFYTAEEAAALNLAAEAAGISTRYGEANPALIAREGSPLDEFMFDRTLNPSQLSIVREILDSNLDPNSSAVNGNVGDVDTAVFQGALAEYTIRDATGNILDLSQPLAVNYVGFLTIEHTLGAANGGGIFDDGTDTLTGIERLQFADRTIELVAGLNESSTGTPLLEALQNNAGTLLFQAGLPIRVATAEDGSLLNVTDPDNPNGGAITNFTVAWQIEDGPGSGVFIDALATGLLFTPPGDPLVGLDGERVRALVTYTDGNGLRETVATAPSPPLTAAVNLIGTPADDLLVGNDRIPNILANQGFGVTLPIRGNDGTSTQPIDGGAGDDEIFGLGGIDVLAGGAGADLIDGGAQNDTLSGNGGDDELFGGTGSDTLEGGTGDDLLDGGAGDDRLIGGAGSNVFDGGGGSDTAVLAGLRGAYTFATTPTGTLEAVAGAVEEELINVEFIEFAGGERITIAQAQDEAGAIRVPAGQTTFIAGAGPQFIIGNNAGETISAGVGADVILGEGGADTLIGDRGADALIGGNGGDILNGGDGADFLSGGNGTDTLNGDGGADTLQGDAANDIINGGGGNDLIIWNAGDGHDLVDGGGNGAVGDTFEINGTGTGETYRFYALTDPSVAAAAAVLGPFAANTEILVTYDDGTGETVIAELDNIEEIVVNTDTLPTSVPGASNIRGDNIEVIGDFTTTSLNVQTITINGSDGNDVIDISKLQSEHRIVFKSNGGNDTLIGNLRPQDVIELPEGTGTTTEVDNGDDTKTVSFAAGSVTFSSVSTPTMSGGIATGIHDLTFTQHDIIELLKLVRGEPSDVLDEPGATGVRDLEGTGNNVANPNWGSADQSFIRLTDARYGEFDPETGHRAINPIFDGLDPRNISNILGTQETGLAKNDAGANIFFMAFGQYFDHGLDFLPKGGFGTLAIGGGDDDPADLTRGTIANAADVANGATPQHINKTSPFVDQNQAYGSTELVGQLLRESDGNSGLGAKLLAGSSDPSNPTFNLLPTLREVILHHWENNTLFKSEKLADQGYTDGEVHFRDYYTVEGTPLVDADGNINEVLAHGLNQNFMGSGHTLVGDANNFIDILDHYVAGDLRANENYTLTSIHTIWARNHNYHVENLIDAGFSGTAEELFQAAKIVNETEYQKVVFNEFADYLLGGLKGSGHHGHDEYNPNADARISHEFAAAVYRVGHSLIGQNITVMDANGNPTSLPLFDAFLNPTNDADAFRVDMDHNPMTTGDVITGQSAVNLLGQSPYNYLPQPGYEQIGVNRIISGIVGQQAEEVDYNLVDAVRNDLVRIRADLFAFNVARGWDVGLGTLNQIRADLLASSDSYIQEAIELSGEDLTPYTSWEDFQQRNGLSDTVIEQFKQAYPDLVLNSQDAIDSFKEANPDITLVGGNTVKGIDRLDLWVGGLAEKHINGGMVGTTFWIVLHEQFDRLQEGDRFYYLDRAEGFDFYQISEEQSFADIVARNTGLEGLDSDIFSASTGDGDDSNSGGGNDGEEDDDTVSDNGSGTDSDSNTDTDTSNGAGTDTGGGSTSATASAVVAHGDDGENALFGSSSDDMLDGGGGDDTIITLDGNDTAVGGNGHDIIDTSGGNDLVFGNSGNDIINAGGGNDSVFGGAGSDRISGGDGDDNLDGGADRDVIDGGAGDDVFIASTGDGDDVYHGGDGIDTLDMEAITANITANLGQGGSAQSDESGFDTIDGIENFKGGAGHDTIIASSSVNVMAGGAGNDTFVFDTAANANGDEIVGFTAGDKIDLSGIAQSLGSGQDFTLTTSFTAAGQIQFRVDGNDTFLEGTINNDNNADFSIKITGTTDLNEQDLV